jgi:hypothetical protein
VYITTGAGGKHLYDGDFTGEPGKWVHPEDGNVAYVQRLVSDRHSISVIELNGRVLVLRQVDQWGNEIDRVKLTKA